MRSRSAAMRIAAMISRRSMRHRLALGDGEDRLLLDLALQRVDLVVAGDDLRRRAWVSRCASASIASRQLVLGKPAHLRRAWSVERLQLVVDRT